MITEHVVNWDELGPDLLEALERIEPWIATINQWPRVAGSNIADQFRLYAAPAILAAKSAKQPGGHMTSVTSIDDHRIVKALEAQIMSFLGDPPDSVFLKGYLSGLMDFYREELGRGIDDPRLKTLDSLCAFNLPGSGEDVSGYGTTKTCGNCRWASGNREWRHCCHNPPKVIPGANQLDDEIPALAGVFPKVFEEWWCGKWQVDEGIPVCPPPQWIAAA